MHVDSKAAVRKQLLHYIDTRTTDYADSVMTVDAGRYYDRDHLALEYEKIVKVHPMIAAHRSELVEPGSTVTVACGGPTLTLRREPDGRIETLLGDGPDMVPAGYPVDEYTGLVWIVPTAGARLDMREYLGPELNLDIEASGIDASKLYRKEIFHLDMNWKLVMDGFTDAYHLQFVHPETVGPLFHTNIYTCDTFGKNWRHVSARKGIENFRSPDEGGTGEIDYEDFANYAIAGFYAYPGSLMARAPAHFELWSIRPDSEDLRRCYVTLYFMVPELPVTDKAKRFRQRNWEIVLSAVRDEDWVVAKSVGDSLVTGGLDRLVYGRNEKSTQAFHSQLDRDLCHE